MTDTHTQTVFLCLIAEILESFLNLRHLKVSNLKMSSQSIIYGQFMNPWQAYLILFALALKMHGKPLPFFHILLDGALSVCNCIFNNICFIDTFEHIFPPEGCFSMHRVTDALS
jgi:hypothetical protein